MVSILGLHPSPPSSKWTARAGSDSVSCYPASKLLGCSCEKFACSKMGTAMDHEDSFWSKPIIVEKKPSTPSEAKSYRVAHFGLKNLDNWLLSRDEEFFKTVEQSSFQDEFFSSRLAKLRGCIWLRRRTYTDGPLTGT